MLLDSLATCGAKFPYATLETRADAGILISLSSSSVDCGLLRIIKCMCVTDASHARKPVMYSYSQQQLWVDGYLLE